MLARYVIADLVRNPRRTLSTMAGVTLGVGLFCGVLFFVDGLSASMTQRAVAPLPIDMQRIVTERVGGTLALTQRFDPPGTLAAGEQASVHLEIRNSGEVAANEVTIRSLPGSGVGFVAGSAAVDGSPVPGFTDNPFAHGPGLVGFNLGTVEPGTTLQVSYLIEGTIATELDATAVSSSYSSREAVRPIAADEQPEVQLATLAALIAEIDGVASAGQLSQGDLGSGALSFGGSVVRGPVKIFGFDASYANRDASIDIVKGAIDGEGSVLSAEAADELGITIGDTVTIGLPDGSGLDLRVTGIADLSRARSLFASRRGGDLEAFVYTRNSIIVSPETFADTVLPSYRRAATARGGRLKVPPVREIDVALERQLLDASPDRAEIETRRIATEISAVADHQDFLLDNISNTLAVAAADAGVAKSLFVFLGVPGGLLAALLSAYAGSVLADAQRREQATLRIRGASRRHLLIMLAARTGALTACGSVVGLAIGYAAAATILGSGSLDRASSSSLLTSAVVGSVGGFLATGAALYLTGRRTLDREINEDRAMMTSRPPLWRRARLDLVGGVVLAVGTAVALQTRAFDGAPGSVYFGRAVSLNLGLLLLPIALWMTGSLLAARVIGTVLDRTQPRSTSRIGRPLPSLYRLSIGRRPWAIANGAAIVSLIVALATSLATFTASYDAAKARDARFANGSDIRIAAGPTAQRTYGIEDAPRFQTDGIAGVTPVIASRRNVILRSARTSDPADLVAVDPATYASVAPLTAEQFSTATPADVLRTLASDPTAVFLSEDMASFLKVTPGDRLDVLLARATTDQVEVAFHVAGLFQRLPGLPDGADALMSIEVYREHVPTKAPDFFLAAAVVGDDAGLDRALAAITRGPAADDHLQVDTRATTLARDQSSLAALNIAGLVALDSTFALGMAVVASAIFVFGLLLQRRREYVTLRAQGLEQRTIRLLIGAEALTVAITGAAAGLLVGIAMGFYFVNVLRPLFVIAPTYVVPFESLIGPASLVLVAALASSVVGSRLVSRLQPTELLRDD